MLDPIVRARDFAYSYPEADGEALHDITFALALGSFTVVAGESASGKSTLLRALVGLVPHFHGGEADGSLVVGGLDVREHGPAALSASCGAVFQDPESQVVMGRVRAEIELALENRGHGAVAVARGVEETALALGIAHLLERSTDTLSGGELQRVALAAALAHRPALLVLDEPTSQLDPVAGDELIWLLRRLNEEWGTAVVIAEHRLERCLGAADRVLALMDGAIACDAPPREFLAWSSAAAPVLATQAARLISLAGLEPPPLSVKEARATLAAAGLEARAATVAEAPAATIPEPPVARVAEPPAALLSRLLTRKRRTPAALELRGVWLELPEGPVILRGVDLRVAAGERIALMGRNGAGKSTLLRLARGLGEPTRGRVERAGEVALLLQSPGDYLIHDHVEDEAGPDALRCAGLLGRERSDPRDLSGGKRQRLALEIVLGGEPVAAICLDEPTRGMDRARKHDLATRLAALAEGGAAVIVATHDTEFAAAACTRVVLMGQGTIVADGPAAAVLAGGWHFSTEVARVLDGAALTPEDGARALTRELVA